VSANKFLKASHSLHFINQGKRGLYSSKESFSANNSSKLRRRRNRLTELAYRLCNPPVLRMKFIGRRKGLRHDMGIAFASESVF